MGWRDAPLAESAGEPAWKRAPLVAPVDEPAAPPPPPPTPGITVGADPRAQYLVDWGKGLFNSVVHPNVDPRSPEGGIFTGAIEPIMALGSGIAAPLLGAKNKYGGQPWDAPTDTRPLEENIQDYSYHPGTQMGQAGAGILGSVLKPLADLLGVAGQGTEGLASTVGASPETAHELGTFVSQVLPAAAGAPSVARGFASAGRAAGNAATGVRNVFAEPAIEPGIGTGVAGDTIARIRSYDHPVTPSRAAAAADRVGASSGDFIGRAIERLVNTGELETRFANKSAQSNEAGLRAYFDLPEGTPLTPEMWRAKAETFNPAYDAVVKELPTVEFTPEVKGVFDALGAEGRNNVLMREKIPEIEALRARVDALEGAPTQDVMDMAKQLRDDASSMYKSADQPGGNPASKRAARAYRRAADGLEEAIGAQVHDPTIFNNFKAARTAKAQIHDIIDSWIGGEKPGGEIDPKAIAARGKDVPLTGVLDNIADAATHMPRTVKSTVGIGSSQGTANAFSTAIAALQHGLTNWWGIPYLMSDFYQNRFGLPGERPTMAPLELPTANPATGPAAPGGRQMGAGSVDFEPTPAVSGQPGLSVGMSDHYGGISDMPWLGEQFGTTPLGAGRLWTDPQGTANPWRSPQGPNVPPEIPPPPPAPPGEPPPFESVNQMARQVRGKEAVPWNPEAPPADLAGALSHAPLELTPDLLSGALGELLGRLPDESPVPWNRQPGPGDRGLRNVRNELNQPPEGVATPEEFPDALGQQFSSGPAAEPPTAATPGNPFEWASLDQLRNLLQHELVSKMPGAKGRAFDIQQQINRLNPKTPE